MAENNYNRRKVVKKLNLEPTKAYTPEEAAEIITGTADSDSDNSEHGDSDSDCFYPEEEIDQSMDQSKSDEEDVVMQEAQGMEIPQSPVAYHDMRPLVESPERDTAGPSNAFHGPKVIVEPAYGPPLSGYYSSESSDDSRTQSPPMLTAENPLEVPDVALHMELCSSTSPQKKAVRNRKTIFDPKSTKKAKRCKAYNRGMKYNDTSGAYSCVRSLTDSKCMNPNKECGFHCSNEFPEQIRQKLLESFWKLGDPALRWQFIAPLVKESQPNPLRKLKHAEKPRSRNLQYQLNKNGTEVRVCKEFFLKTLAISERMVQTALTKRSEFGSVTPDKRGQHGKQATTNIQEVEKQRAREHISSFPVIESHYCRSKCIRRYLDPTLNIREMYRQFQKFAVENKFAPIKESLYRHIFNTEFNLGFHRPKKDQCALCDSYKNCSPEQQVVMQEKIDKHLEMKDLCRSEKNSDKVRASTDPSFVTMTFDLEKVLTCPCSQNSLLYYVRKLSVYNFTIYELASKQGFCYTWDETKGNRGSCEVGTGVFNWLKSLPKTVTHISIFSDTCGGQNRNQYFSAMLLSAVRDPDISVKIVDQKFFESGHSDMECDSMHAAIEVRVKHHHINVPNDYLDVFKTARRSAGTEPYKVVAWDGSEIVDWKAVSQKLLPNVKQLENGEKMNWLKLKQLRYDTDHPDKIFIKYDFREDFKTLKVSAKRGRPITDASLQELVKKRCYTGPLPIGQAKKKDLMGLCKKNVIPYQCHEYYKKICSSEEVPDEVIVQVENGDSDYDEEY